MPRFSPTLRSVLVGSLVAMGGAALLSGCGGGGSGGGAQPPSTSLLIGNQPVVQKLTTPLGLNGTRGSGAQVFVSYNLRDTEFNPCDIQIEYGYDDPLNPDGAITGSETDPSPSDEYFPCTAAPGTQVIGLDSARGKGADHIFVWNSTADVKAGRFVTQDYDYTAQGRKQLDANGLPLFGTTPAIRLRMRANDNGGAPDRWSPWKVTEALDLNNNRQPSLTIAGGGLFGVNPNATGSAADEDVVLNLLCIDEDSGLGGANDLQAVAVDYAPVPTLVDVLPAVDTNSDGIPDQYGDGTPETPFNAANPIHLTKLTWSPATTFAGTADTGLLTSTAPGTAHTYTWDSVADAGTVNGKYILRATPFDSKKELGNTVAQSGSFTLDNFTIFTDVGVGLATPRVGHRGTVLAVNDNRVLVTGGRTTAAGASVATAELFYPGIGQTTFGAVAATGSMNAARSFHTQTRLLDDRVLVTGGIGGAGAPIGSLEVYDPVLGTWSTLGATLGTARARHAAILLASGDVLLAGGVDGAGNALSRAEIYHVDTNSVTTVPGGMIVARHSVEGALLPGGKALIPGGKNTGGTGLSSTEIYDPATNSFAAGNAMASARAEHSVSSAVDGRVIVAGGIGLNNVEIFNPKTGLWSTVGATMTSVRAGHVGAILGDGSILMAGGSNGAAVVGTANILTPGLAAFDVPNGSMKTARRDAANVLLNNGRVLIIGGLNGAGATLSSIEVFTPDGGFNYRPTAKITTPLEEQSYKYGALFNYRLIDPEQSKAKVIFQYSIAGGAWKPCTSQGGFYLDGTNDPDTIGGDINEGTVDMVTAAADSALPIDPVLKNTAGDHLFIWDMSADIVQADYPSVKVRCVPFGPGRGVLATTNSFKIAKNTRVIPRFEGFAGPVHGSIDVWYHLQDIDGAPGPNGDPARVEFEYGIDLNNDKQILTDDGESFKACTEAPNPPSSSEGLGAGYTLATSKTYVARLSDSTGWHLFTWDSIRDVGSPDVSTQLTNVILRITPYDNPDILIGGTESKGRQATLTSASANGLTIDFDTTGLYLVAINTETSGATYTTYPTNSGTLPFAGFKLDEMVIFTFSREVDPASVDGAVGLNSVKVTVGGRQVLGSYEVNTADYTQVRFYPQINGVTNGALQYNGSENPTVLTRGVSAAVSIPGYTPGTNPETAPILRARNWTAGIQGVDLVNLVTRTYSPLVSTTASAGTAAYVARAIAPTATTSTPVDGDVNQSLTQGFSIEFDGQISGESYSTANLRFLVDINGNGSVDPNDSVIPGTISIANTAGPAGARKSIITFTPTGGAGFNLPANSRILASFAGMKAADGTAVLGYGGVSPTVTTFYTQAGGTSTAQFFETFANTSQRDAANTNAFWNDPLFPGMLTSYRDAGDGSDGSPSGVTGLNTFSAKATYNFSSLTIPKDQNWRFTGTGSNSIVTLNVSGAIDIAGVLNVAGGDAGQGTYDEYYTYTSTMTPYGKHYSSSQSSGGTATAGGTGIAGGGAGGNSRFISAGTNGAAGAGASAGSIGLAGGVFNSNYATGGSGAGHAQAGGAGGIYSNSSTYGTISAGGAAFGSTTLASGPEAGSGGGGGGSYPYSYYIYDVVAAGSTTYNYFYTYHNGGAGGGGGGAVKITCNGTFILRGSGVIDASGGDGGNGMYYYTGGGGGGSGGSVWIRCGGGLTVGGIIDVRGGLGGQAMAYHGGYSNGGSPTRHGTFGGHGSAGRVRIEGPNVSTTTTNFVAGTSFSSLSSALGGGTGALGAFPGSTSASINIDSISKDGSGVMNFTTMSIPAGVTITLTGTSAAKMRFTGNVSISGTLTAPGGTGAAGQYGSSTASVIAAGAAGPGGSPGGLPNGSSVTNHFSGLDGGGSGGGKGGIKGGGWVSGSYTYYYGQGSAGGGTNMLNFSGYPVGNVAGGTVNSLCNLSGQGTINLYYGAGYGAYRGPFAPAGTGFNDPELLTMTSLVGGSGGGGGANGGYRYTGGSTSYFYGGSSGGGGGGAIAIETSNTITMASTGIISAPGGAGGQYPYSNLGGAGGSGAGGTILLRANSFSLSNGASITTYGGVGGLVYSSPTSYDWGAGGAGGIGVARLESTTQPNVLNTGGILGYSATTGSLTTANYQVGDKGTTIWLTAAGLSPDFSNQVLSTQGNTAVTIEGAMADPVTGLKAATTGSQVIFTYAGGPAATALTSGLGTPNAIDGFKYYRFIFNVAAPTPAVPASPAVFDAQVDVTTQ
jgi:hypothetical protein